MLIYIILILNYNDISLTLNLIFIIFFSSFFNIIAAYGVYILEPIPTEGLTSADAGSLMQQTYDAMNEVFELTTLVSKDDLWMDVREILKQKKVEKDEDGRRKEEKLQDPLVEEAKQWNSVDDHMKMLN